MAALGGIMSGIVQFIRSIVIIALTLGFLGTLVESTNLVGRAAAKAHQHGGISFKWLNQQLVGPVSSKYVSNSIE